MCGNGAPGNGGGSFFGRSARGLGRGARAAGLGFATGMGGALGIAAGNGIVDAIGGFGRGASPFYGGEGGYISYGGEGR